MELCRHFWLGVTLAATGCSTLKPDDRLQGGGAEFHLSQQDSIFAQALAHYGQGLILAAEIPSNSLLAESHLLAAATLSNSPRPARRAAHLALEDKRTGVAIEHLRTICQTAPTALAWNDLGAALTAANNHKEALAAFTQALALAPASTATHINCIDAVIRLPGTPHKQITQAIDDAVRLADSPELILLYIDQCSQESLAQKHYATARILLQGLAANHPTLSAAYLQRLTAIYMLEDNIPGALEHLKRAIRHKPTPELYLLLCQLQLIETPNAALRTITTAAITFPDSPSIHFQRACTLSDLGRHADAILDFKKARGLLTTEASPTPALSRTFYIRYAVTYERAGDTKSAERLLIEGIAAHPTGASLLNGLAYMWAEQSRNLQDAMRHVSRALRQEPNNPAFLDTRGWILFRMQRFPEALNDLQRAHRILGYDNPEILLHIGDVHEALGNHRGASQAWIKAHRADPDLPGLKQRLDRATQASDNAASHNED
jgi:tetratricopeptide (TPR) repeat protein